MKRLSVAVNVLLSMCMLAWLTGNRAFADAEVTFRGMLIEAPPCVVNNNQPVVVDFGNEVMTTRVDGSNYKQPITFTLDCSEALSSKQKVRISGKSADFDTSALTTDKTGLAIALYNGAKRYTPGEWLPFTDPDLPMLEAVPIKQDGVALSGGAFSMLASLVVDYQ